MNECIYCRYGGKKFGGFENTSATAAGTPGPGDREGAIRRPFDVFSWSNSGGKKWVGARGVGCRQGSAVEDGRTVMEFWTWNFKRPGPESDMEARDIQRVQPAKRVVGRRSKFTTSDGETRTEPQKWTSRVWGPDDGTPSENFDKFQPNGKRSFRPRGLEGRPSDATWNSGSSKETHRGNPERPGPGGPRAVGRAK